MFCTNCGNELQKRPSFCPNCGSKTDAATAPSLGCGGETSSALSKYRLPIIIGGAAALVAVILIMVFSGGRNIVGSWNAIEARYYEFINNRWSLEDVWRVEEDDSFRLEFRNDGSGIITDSDGWIELFDWRMNGNRLYIDGTSSVTVNISRNELRITNEYGWYGGLWREVMIYRRVR
ncbi:MAG: hypothetical protein FWC95_03185 [Defluviitaleaceae bacterium]|nr:hypothetical protein [Defluviitaleaceae bacterium]